MKVLMLLQLLFFSNLMIDVCGHICPLDWEINPPPPPHPPYFKWPLGRRFSFQK